LRSQALAHAGVHREQGQHEAIRGHTDVQGIDIVLKGHHLFRTLIRRFEDRWSLKLKLDLHEDQKTDDAREEHVSRKLHLMHAFPEHMWQLKEPEDGTVEDFAVTH
jgi:hypothetical protein